MCAPWAFSEPILHKTCDSLACDNLLVKTVWNLWKFTRTFWNCEAVVFCTFLVNSLKIITHYIWPITWLFIVKICSFSFEHSTPLSSFWPQTAHNSQWISVVLMF
jgi:hypothetical protein